MAAQEEDRKHRFIRELRRTSGIAGLDGSFDLDEAELRRFERIFSPAVDHISIISRNYLYLLVNDACLKAHGKTRGQVVGRSAGETLGKEKFETVVKSCLDRCFEGEVISHQDWFDFPGAGQRFMSSAYYPFFSGSEITGAFVTSRDITEHRRAEEKIREQLYFLQKLIDSIPSPIFYKGTDGRYLGCNRAFEEITGLAGSEIIGKTVHDVKSGEFAKAFADMDEELFRNSGVMACEHPVEYADGTVHDVIFRKAAYTRMDGTVAGLVGVMMDITEQRRYERVIEQSEKKYRHLFEDLNDAAFLADADTGRVIETNTQGEALLGRTRREITGMHYKEFYPVEKADRYGLIFAAAAGQGRLACQEAEVVKKDGTVVPVQVSAAPMAVGEKTLLLGIFRDVSSAKKAGEELRRNKEMAEGLIRSMKDGFSAIDASGSHIYVNEAFCAMIGYTREEIMRFKPPYPWWPEDCRDALHAMLQRIMKGEFEETELTLRRKSGELFPVIINPSSITDGEGRVVCYLGTIKDISGRKKAEEELCRTKKLESMGMLAAGIAQDFNCLLARILTNISLARLYGGKHGRGYKRLVEAERAALKARELTRQLQAFSKDARLP